MDISNTYSDPIITQKRKGTPDDPFLSYTETLAVVNGRVVLTEIPNKFHKVSVVGENRDWREIPDGELKGDLYRVDYVHGSVYFSAEHNNKSLTFYYYGEGVVYSPASRIWIRQTGGEVEKTLQESVDASEAATAEVNVKIQQATDKIAETEEARQATFVATQEAYERTSDYETAVLSAKRIYKPMVATYSDIATTYPNPEVGWTTSTQDDNLEYRFDGFEWINTGYVDRGGGIDVWVGKNPPENVNYMWLEDSTVDVPYLTRIVMSETEPADHTKLWLDLSDD